MGATLASRGLSRSDIVKRVLGAIPETGSIGAACKMAGISRTEWHRWRKQDPELARQTQAAMDRAIRDQLDTGRGIAARVIEAADEADDPKARRETLDWLARYTLPVAKARLPEYKKDNGGGNSGISLNISLSGLVALPDQPPAPAIDTTATEPALPEPTEPASTSDEP